MKDWIKEFDEKFQEDGFTESDAAYCEDAASRAEGCWKLKDIKSFIQKHIDLAEQRGRDGAVDYIKEEWAVGTNMTKKQSEHGHVLVFATEMLDKLYERQGRYRKMGWLDSEYKTLDDLDNHLLDEVREWREAETTEDKMAELVDVANSAFMIYDRLRLEKEK